MEGIDRLMDRSELIECFFKKQDHELARKKTGYQSTGVLAFARVHRLTKGEATDLVLSRGY